MTACQTPPVALDLSQGLTLDICRAQLALWITCSQGIATNQSYRIGDYEYRRADLDQVMRMIDRWEAKCREVQAGTSSRTKVVRRVC